MSLSEQMAQLRKKEWVDLHGLISCANIHLSTAGPCMSVSLLGRGSFNHVYKLVFTDGTQIAASVLYSDIPVPRVYAFDTTFDNPAGAPYILMDVLRGQTLDDLRDGNGLHGLDTLPPEQQLSTVKSFAKLHPSLSKPVPYDAFGSITTATQGDHVVGPLMRLTQQCLGGPFKSFQDLWRDQIEHSIIHALQEWSNNEKDDLSQDMSEPHCTPQTFSGIIQLLSAVILYFTDRTLIGGRSSRRRWCAIWAFAKRNGTRTSLKETNLQWLFIDYDIYNRLQAYRIAT